MNIVPRRMNVGSVKSVHPSRFVPSGHAVSVLTQMDDAEVAVLLDLKDFRETPEIGQKVRYFSTVELCDPSECEGASVKVLSLVDSQVEVEIIEDYELRRLVGPDNEADVIGSTIKLRLDDLLPHVPTIGEILFYNRTSHVIVEKPD